MAEEHPPEKKARTGTMPSEMRNMIEAKLAQLGEIWQYKRSHKKHQVAQRTLPPEDLIHEKSETVRSGQAQRVHYKCSNPNCADMIRSDKRESHVIKMTSDAHLQELPDHVLERNLNFAPDVEHWDNKENRMMRIVTFMECTGSGA